MKIYLDNSAGTRIDPKILEKVLEVEKEFYGNPSSVHSEGQRAKMELEHSRDFISKILECRASELIFTSSGTEANNLAIRGILKKGDHAICSSIEHSSVLNTYKGLEDIEVSILPVNSKGIIDIEKLGSYIKKNTKLISVMHANNEVGTIQPIEKVKKLKGDVLLHVDAVQTIGKIKNNPLKVADICSFTAHKIHGPRGIGCLYVKKGVEINKVTFGGEQEWNKRAGTENLGAIIGLKEALKISYENLEEEFIKISKLKNYFEHRVLKEILDCEINGDLETRIPSISNIYFSGVRNDILLFRLDMEGIYTSAGSACASGSIDPSHVLKAMNLPLKRQKSSIRFSLSKYNTLHELDYTIEKLKEIVNKIRSLND